MKSETEPETRERVAIVTGSDRGIGFAVCLRLGKLGFQIILTSPDPVKGKASAAKLRSQGSCVVFHVLDVMKESHVAALRSFVLKKFGYAEILVNNAGVMLDGGRSRLDGMLRKQLDPAQRKLGFGEGPGILQVDMDLLRATLEVNTLGALRMCQAFVPLMTERGFGRIVNVSSRLGQLKNMGDAEKVPAYQMSKTALNAVTRMVADACGSQNVLVNSVCPGWTRTDIGGPEAPQSTEEAARTIVWLATLPEGGPTGGFFYDKKRITW
jgi:NAD(P)-dependent dehydrogenase (short-subunit alcohol dehydrogenase family)